jgi:hypothetical protein
MSQAVGAMFQSLLKTWRIMKGIQKAVYHLDAWNDAFLRCLSFEHLSSQG